jgi:hypothetical protein
LLEYFAIPTFEAKNASWFFWRVCAIYPNVGHKICMFNEKNDEDKN